MHHVEQSYKLFRHTIEKLQCNLVFSLVLSCNIQNAARACVNCDITFGIVTSRSVAITWRFTIMHHENLTWKKLNHRLNRTCCATLRALLSHRNVCRPQLQPESLAKAQASWPRGRFDNRTAPAYNFQCYLVTVTQSRTLWHCKHVFIMLWHVKYINLWRQGDTKGIFMVVTMLLISLFIMLCN